MSSKTKCIAKKVNEQRSRMYMDNMYQLFNLPLYQLLKLRHEYRSYMSRRRRKEQKQLARAIRRSYDKKVR